MQSHPPKHNDLIPPELIEEPVAIEPRLVSTLLTQKPNSNSYVAVAITILLMALATVFYWKNGWGLAELLPAVKQQVFSNHQWWRVFTATFIHADMQHFFSNMFMLGIFSFLVYGYFGFWLFPVFSLTGATLVNALAIYSYEPDTRLLGASGLVYLLGGMWLTLYFLIQRQRTVSNRILRMLGGALMIFWPTTFVPSTSYRTHAIGFAVGIFIGLIYFALSFRKIRRHEVYK